MKAKNSKKSKAHKFVLSFLQRLGLKNSGKYVTLQKLSFYYTRKNMTLVQKKPINSKLQFQHGTISLSTLIILIQ